VLFQVWELSDIDRDGMLDRDEFAVAMYLVYRALEKEPVPMSLPAPLVPPSKRKKWVVSPADKAKYDDTFMKTDKDKDGLVSGPEVRDIFLKTGLPSATLAKIWELCDTSDAGKLNKEQFALALYLINQKLAKGIDPPQALTPEMLPPSDRLLQQGTLSSLAADFSAIKELDSLSNEIIDLQRSSREKTTVEQEIKEKEESIKQKTSEVQDLQDEVQRESGELQKLQAQRQEIQEVLGKLDQQKEALEEQLGKIRQQCTQESELISKLQTERVDQERKISRYEEELAQAHEQLRQLQLETAQLEEKVEASKAQLSPLEESLHSSQQEVSKVLWAIDYNDSTKRGIPVIGYIGSLSHAFVVQQKLLELKEMERDSRSQTSWRQHLVGPLVNGTSEEEVPKTPEEDPAVLEDIYSSIPSTLKQDTPAENTTEEKEELPEDSPPKPQSLQKRPEPSQSNPSTESGLDFFQSDPFTDNDPFKDDPFTKVDVSDPFGEDPFKGTDPFAADSFFKQPSADPFATADPFSGAPGNPPEADPFSSKMETTLVNDPFAPGGTAVTTGSDPVCNLLCVSLTDPFASVFGSDTFGGGFADFSNLSKSNGSDPFSSDVLSSKNLFQEDRMTSPDVPPALPPKTGTPTRPPPPPPGKRSSISRSESSDSFHRKGSFLSRGSGDSSRSQEEKLQDPFSPSSPRQTLKDPDSFASFDKKYPTEEDMIEWVKRESEREEKERLARLTQQEQEDLELAIALSKSELS
uniref:Epidermal growth factor receptor pathway substrate 15 n=1 Tax=Lepisosteus oculatus TaxID=7918 RepID=W5MT32_LEPOC